MAQSLDEGRTALTWSGRAVELDRIEEELVRLRYEAGGAGQEGKPFAIRTSFLNLVVHAADEESARHASQVIAALPSYHPSRSLITVARPSAGESRIDAALSAHCHIAPGVEPQVCCEEVRLRVSGQAADHLHSVIEPLLVSDLPVYVWWTGELPRNPHLFEEMIGASDRVIVDSGEFESPAAGLARLMKLRAERRGLSVGDLAWNRLAPWREVLSQWLEAPSFGSVTQVDVTAALGAEATGQSSQVLLLLGWLAGRLGWRVQDEGGRPGSGAATVRAGGTAVEITTAESKGCEGLTPGWLVSVALAGGAAGRVSVRRDEDPLHLAVSVEEGESAHEGRIRTEECSEAEMLSRELERLGRHEEFEQAVKRATEIARALS